MPNVNIPTKANATLDKYVGKKKAEAAGTKKRRPSEITKGNILAHLVEKYLAHESDPPESPKIK